MAMTLEQALAFKISGKALRDMSKDDWRQWLKRTRTEKEVLALLTAAARRFRCLLKQP